MHPVRQALRLVLASSNAKKLAELRAMLAGLAVNLVAQAELGIAEAEEPHCTFIENALAKARQAAAAAQGPAIADDSGLCVHMLGGAPGVISAHYAGEVPSVVQSFAQSVAPSVAQTVAQTVAQAAGDREARRRLQDAANNRHLLLQLEGVTDRRAHFISTLVAVRHAQDPQPLVAVGRWPGEILSAPRGEQGFGYDPLMFIPDLGCTVAEMDARQKNQHSHRSRAVVQMQALLREVWTL